MYFQDAYLVHFKGNCEYDVTIVGASPKKEKKMVDFTNDEKKYHI